MFTDREKFIQALTVFTVSLDALKIPGDERALALDYIRRTKCKSITDDDWNRIADEVDQNKAWIVSSLADYKNEVHDDIEEPEEDDVEDEDETAPTPASTDDDVEDESDELSPEESENILDDIMSGGAPPPQQNELEDLDDEDPEEEPEPQPKPSFSSVPKKKSLSGLLSKKS